MRIRYDATLMASITLFERVTGTAAKDCIPDGEGLLFVVGEAQIGKAIGRGGQNVHLLEEKLNRKIKIVEFNPSVRGFVENLIFPLRAKEIREDGNRITIVGADSASKGSLIGRNGLRLKNLTDVVKRFFPIEKITVI